MIKGIQDFLLVKVFLLVILGLDCKLKRWIQTMLLGQGSQKGQPPRHRKSYINGANYDYEENCEGEDDLFCGKSEGNPKPRSDACY